MNFLEGKKKGSGKLANDTEKKKKGILTDLERAKHPRGRRYRDFVVWGRLISGRN